MASGKLTPLGDPAPNGAKWFAAMEVISLAAGNGLRHDGGFHGLVEVELVAFHGDDMFFQLAGALLVTE